MSVLVAALVSTPDQARRGDCILASQIEDEQTTIRASLNERALGGPTDVLLWRDTHGQYKEFRPRGYWYVRTR